MAYPTKSQLERMSDAEIRRKIRCAQSSHESRHTNSKDSCFIAMAQLVLSQRGRAQVGANLCGGGSKEKGLKGRSF
jgi:hypothetical protein